MELRVVQVVGHKQHAIGVHPKLGIGMTSLILTEMVSLIVDQLETKMVVVLPTSIMPSRSLKWSIPATLVGLKVTGT